MAKAGKKVLFAAGLTLVVIALGSCGGGGGGQAGNTNPPSPTVKSVSVSCNPTSVQNGQTSQCSASVAGTGSYSTAVTWSTDLGAIDSSGKYTAPTSGTGTAKVTATSQQDTTKSGSATITVSSQTSLVPTGLMAVPSILVSGQQTQVTFSVFVAGADSSTVVQIYNLSGGTASLIGTMTDDGQGSDQVAGDHLYTIVTALTPPAAASLPLQAVATEGTAGSQNGNFSVPLIQIPTYTTNTDVNQAESQIYDTAIQIRTSFPTMDWASPSQQQTFVNNLTSMFSQLVGVAEQNTALQAAAQLRQTNALFGARSASPHPEGVLQSIFAFFYPVLGMSQNAQSCDQLIDSIPGNPNYGSTSYPFSTLSPDNPNMQDFADAMATASEGVGYYFSPDDFLTNDSSSYYAYLFASDYLSAHQLSPAIGGCGGGIAQQGADVAVKSEVGQFTGIGARELSSLTGGGVIKQVLISKANDKLVGWVVDSLNKPTVVIGQVGANESFDAPAGTFNLATSFGGDTANGTITNTPVYPNTTTIVNPSPGANITVTPPYVTGLVPSLGPVGTVVSIDGSGFDANPASNVVTFNGTAAQVSASTASSIQTSVPVGAISGPITVTTSSGSTTSSLDFTVSGAAADPLPSISSLSPTSLPASGSQQTLTINGTGFLATSSVTFNGIAHNPTVVSNSQLTILLTSADLSTMGSFPVVVTNPAPGGGSSNAVDLIVGNPVPTITSLSPSSVAAGSAAQTLTINGSNFLSSSVVAFNGSNAATTFVSSTQLTIALTAADLATAGSFPVSVTNPSPDGGTSNVVDFNVLSGAPGSVTISPAAITVPEGGAQTFTASPVGSVDGVTWSIQEGAGGGTIASPDSTTVVYFPPSGTGTFHVVATNADDSSQTAVATVTVVPAVTLTTLHSFQSTQGEGWDPLGRLIQASDGNFYGTTTSGGASNSGTVFRVDSTGNFTTVHSFNGTDGGIPDSGLIQTADGNLYGTTFYGGAFGRGEVYRIDGAGNLTVLTSFTEPGPVNPYAGLIQASDGQLYGTTYYGGPSESGTAFKMDTSGKVTWLHSFSSSEGAPPYAGLIQATDGNFYGTLYYGGAGGGTGAGTVYKMDASGNVTVLHSFSFSDGAGPSARLVQSSDGNLYGTTTGGGAFGHGAIFKVSTIGDFTVLHSFSAYDGNGPDGGLIQGTDGNFYGTTSGDGPSGGGTIFKMDPKGNVTVLFSFDNSDGLSPPAEPIFGTDGNLYGVTEYGGSGGAGTVYRLNLH
jgi:uncharacterized repeat protein (TIGR03803 family)